MNLSWKYQVKIDPELGGDLNTPTVLSLAACTEGLPTQQFEMLHGNLCQLFSSYLKDTDATRMCFVHLILKHFEGQSLELPKSEAITLAR